jgi:uncharacterized protein (DUF433 family)
MVTSGASAVHSKALESATVLDEQLLARITADEKTFGGKPVVRGSRVPVELVLSLLAQGASHTEILDDYADLVEEDILACLAYARAVIGRDSLEPIEVGRD